MPTKLNLTKDVAGYNAFGLVPSQDSYAGLLATAAAQTITVPSEYPAYLAVMSFTPGSNIWVNFSTTAVTPSGSIGANLNELNPAGRRVLKGSTISFITPDAAGAYVSVLFYVVPEFGN
jgi:hypothetical protein